MNELSKISADYNTAVKDLKKTRNDKIKEIKVNTKTQIQDLKKARNEKLKEAKEKIKADKIARKQDIDRKVAEALNKLTEIEERKRLDSSGVKFAKIDDAIVHTSFTNLEPLPVQE